VDGRGARSADGDSRYRFSVAPMMDCTESALRCLLAADHCHTPSLHEMVVAQGLHHGVATACWDFRPLRKALASGWRDDPAARRSAQWQRPGGMTRITERGLPKRAGAEGRFRLLMG